MPRAQIKDEKTDRKLREHGENEEKLAAPPASHDKGSHATVDPAGRQGSEPRHTPQKGKE